MLTMNSMSNMSRGTKLTRIKQEIKRVTDMYQMDRITREEKKKEVKRLKDLYFQVLNEEAT